MEYFIKLDQRLFLLINGHWINPLADHVMVFITNFRTMAPIIGLLVFYALFKFRVLALKAVLFSIIAILLSDQVSSHVIKPLVHRQRPSFALEDNQVRLLVPRSGSPSFPSSHAANVFAVATAASLVLTGLSFPLYFLAAAVAYSRVYVGVHFPLDVLGGAFLGLFMGLIAWRLSLAFDAFFGFDHGRKVKFSKRSYKKRF